MNLDDLNIELDENMQIKQLKRPKASETQTLVTEQASSMSFAIDTTGLETLSIDTSSIDTSDLDMGEADVMFQPEPMLADPMQPDELQQPESNDASNQVAFDDAACVEQNQPAHAGAQPVEQAVVAQSPNVAAPVELVPARVEVAAEQAEEEVADVGEQVADVAEQAEMIVDEPKVSEEPIEFAAEQSSSSVAEADVSEAELIPSAIVTPVEVAESSVAEQEEQLAEGYLVEDGVVEDGVVEDRRAEQRVVEDNAAEKISGVQSANEQSANEQAANEENVSVATREVEAKSEVEAEAKPVVEKVDPDKLLFKDLPLSHQVQLSVQQAGYIEPTDIQARIIPEMLAGRDLVAQSQTGTGKTAAFALPILSKLDLAGKQDRVSPTVLVLAPTRELAQQVATSFERYGDCIPRLRITAVYGGADYEPQLRSLRRGVHVVVGTPGRIIDHIKRGSLKLDAIECLVLDEADEMLNMGFLEDVQFVLSNTPEKRQIALFSATMPGPIREIAEKYLNDPVKVTVRKQTLTADSITQKCVFVNERNKLDLLARIMEIETTDGVIVFTKTKDSTVAVAERLAKLGLSAAALNGDLPQTRRQRTVDQLKAGQLDIVVATDVAARGLDVQRISHVFNYDLPHDSESYVHRIGRTGRAGRAGTAYIFLTPAQRGKLRYIENATRKPIEVVLAPTARQVNEKRLSDFKEQVITTAQRKKLRKPFQRVVAECIEESGLTAEEVAAAIAAVANADRPFVAGDIPEPDLRRGRPDSRPPRGDRRGSSGARPARRGMKRYRIEVGSSDGVKPGNIVGAIANEAGIAGCDIGAISIQDSYSTVDLPEEVTPNIANQLSRTWVAGKQLRLRPVGDYDDAGDNRRGGQSRWQSGGKKGGKPFAKRKGPGKPFKSGGKKPGGKKSFRPAK